MTPERLDQEVESFVASITPPPTIARYDHSSVELEKLGKRNQPSSWCQNPGIYSFWLAGELLYIGRAVKDTLGMRLWDQVRPRAGEWRELVLNPDTRVILYAFGQPDWYWVASLEVLLLDKLNRPLFNKRSC